MALRLLSLLTDPMTPGESHLTTAQCNHTLEDCAGW